MPNLRTRSPRALFHVSQGSRSSTVPETVIVWPAVSESAWGEPAGYSSVCPASRTASGTPSRTDRWAARRRVTGAESRAGGSPP